MTAAAPTFQNPLFENPFLALFPWRWDFLYAPLPHPEKPTCWNTESRHPLTDRAIQAGKQLYGVRFGESTNYFLLDIDKGSVYHPNRDPFAIGNIVYALEILGITNYVAVTSSYSGGVHLYFPFRAREEITTWQLAAVVDWVLSKKFVISPGVLEVFPNKKPVPKEGEEKTLYNGHRLPLQQGSYLLSPDWELEWSDQIAFLNRWMYCESRNKLNHTCFFRNLYECAQFQRNKKLSHPAAKFLNDLNNDINGGWTGYGQTNFLLGRLALRSYVFSHFTEGGGPITGERLVMHIVSQATQLPGYRQYCRHQHEIYKRAEEWARSVEACPRYYPYGKKELQVKEPEPEHKDNTWNQRQEKDARERLELAMAVLIHNDSLPQTISERFDVLTERFRFSGQTLYKHAEVWHPHPDSLWKTPSDSPNSEAYPFADRFGAAAKKYAKLITPTGCNPRNDAASALFAIPFQPSTGCKPAPDNDLDRLNPFRPVEKHHDPDKKSPG